MGCVASKLDINDVHPNMFAVSNVDDMGLKLSAGQLEITETELVLHQRGRQPARWPLRYLKRYGFEAGLFSFEAGRKTPTGPGVYAFKCRRAENLFNLLQVRVREQPAPPPDPRTLSLPSAAHTPTEEQAPGRDGSPSYINCSLAGPGPVPASAPASPQYENVGPGDSPGYVPPGAVFQLPARPDPDPAAQEDRVSPSEGEREEEGPTTVNYIVLDLEKPVEQAGPGQQEQLEPAAAAAGRYVTIDFDKTDALIKSANQRFF